MGDFDLRGAFPTKSNGSLDDPSNLQSGTSAAGQLGCSGRDQVGVMADHFYCPGLEAVGTGGTDVDSSWQIAMTDPFLSPRDDPDSACSDEVQVRRRHRATEFGGGELLPRRRNCCAADEDAAHRAQVTDVIGLRPEIHHRLCMAVEGLSEGRVKRVGRRL